MEQGIVVRVPVYTVTLVCPLCHRSITWEREGVTVCPHCGRSFVVKRVDGRQ